MSHIKNRKFYKVIIAIAIPVISLVLGAIIFITHLVFLSPVFNYVVSRPYDHFDLTKYPVEIIFQNVDLLEEEDCVWVYDERALHDILYSSEAERYTNLDISYSINKYNVSSKLFPEMEAQVNSRDDEKVIIYIDYLTKTITVKYELISDNVTRSTVIFEYIGLDNKDWYTAIAAYDKNNELYTAFEPNYNSSDEKRVTAFPIGEYTVRSWGEYKVGLWVVYLFPTKIKVCENEITYVYVDFNRRIMTTKNVPIEE